jgi:hypothetical protein
MWFEKHPFVAAGLVLAFLRLSSPVACTVFGGLDQLTGSNSGTPDLDAAMDAKTVISTSIDAGADSNPVDTIAPYRTEVLKDSPVAFYPFEESGTAAETVNAADDAGLPTCITIGNVLWGQPSHLPSQRAVGLRGAGYLKCSASPRFDFSSQQPFSVETWVRFQNIPSGAIYGILGRFAITGDSSGFGLAMTDKRGFDIKRNVFSFVEARGGQGANPAPATWTHVVGTFGNQTLSIFINGQRSASTTDDSDASVPSTSEPLIFGASGKDGLFKLDGDISNIAIYNRELSADRIQAHYSAGSPTSGGK